MGATATLDLDHDHDVQSTLSCVSHILSLSMSKEPTRAQLSSRLTYQARVPAFLQRLQRGAGGGGEDDDDEFEYDGSGRPPIPRRPDIPERPDDDPGSADEDDGEEKPQVVVLKEGKHLTEREAENERRKGMLYMLRLLCDEM